MRGATRLERVTRERAKERKRRKRRWKKGWEREKKGEGMKMQVGGGDEIEGEGSDAELSCRFGCYLGCGCGKLGVREAGAAIW